MAELQLRKVRFPWLLRVVGGISILHVLIGLLFSLGTIFFVPRMDKMDPSIFNKDKILEAMAPMLKDMTEEQKDEMDKFDFSKMPQIMASSGFKSFFYSFAAISL